jgi:hypothetical protein
LAGILSPTRRATGSETTDNPLEDDIADDIALCVFDRLVIRATGRRAECANPLQLVIDPRIDRLDGVHTAKHIHWIERTIAVVRVLCEEQPLNRVALFTDSLSHF